MGSCRGEGGVGVGLRCILEKGSTTFFLQRRKFSIKANRDGRNTRLYMMGKYAEGLLDERCDGIALLQLILDLYCCRKHLQLRSFACLQD